MNPRAVARAAVAAGWGTGLALILAGLPVLPALAVPVSASAGAAWWTWRGATRFAALQARASRWMTGRGKKGTVVERA
jgi:NCAIR mutase (PurE)-related protein